MYFSCSFSDAWATFTRVSSFERLEIIGEAVCKISDGYRYPVGGRVALPIIRRHMMTASYMIASLDIYRTKSSQFHS